MSSGTATCGERPPGRRRRRCFLHQVERDEAGGGVVRHGGVGGSRVDELGRQGLAGDSRVSPSSGMPQAASRLEAATRPASSDRGEGRVDWGPRSASSFGGSTIGSSTTNRAPGLDRRGGPRPTPSAVQAHVLVDEGEPEADAGVGGAVAALAAVGEAVEDDVALVLGHPVAVVLDRHLDLVVGQLEGDGGGAAGVALGVVEEVGDYLAEAPLVDPHHDVADVGVVALRHAAAAEDAHGLDDHLGDRGPPRGGA